MTELCRDPRNYKIFICHCYGDDPLYAALRHSLNTAKSFAWTNLSVQTDRPLRLRTENGLRASLTSKVKNADLMLVFAHSAGQWIEHEIDAAVRFGVPIVSVLDPARLGQAAQRSRTEKIAANAVGEVRLDDAARIVAAVRRYARPQGVPATERVSISRLVSREADPSLARPQDIARRLERGRERQGDTRGLLARLGQLFFWRSGRAVTR